MNESDIHEFEGMPGVKYGYSAKQFDKLTRGEKTYYSLNFYVWIDKNNKDDFSEILVKIIEKIKLVTKNQAYTHVEVFNDRKVQGFFAPQHFRELNNPKIRFSPRNNLEPYVVNFNVWK